MLPSLNLGLTSQDSKIHLCAKSSSALKLALTGDLKYKSAFLTVWLQGEWGRKQMACFNSLGQ